MITARGLSPTFKTKTGPVDAVKGVDFDVAEGEIVGLLGPNGAGKTTTLRMLTTLLTPRPGRPPSPAPTSPTESREVRRRIGYVAQIGAVPAPGTRLGEELIVQARLQGMSKPPPRRGWPTCCPGSTSPASSAAPCRRCRAASAGASTSRWA